MVALIFLVICALAAVICFIFSISRTVELVKNPTKEVSYTAYFKRAIPLVLGFMVAFTAMLIWIYPACKITPKVYESIQAVIGGAIFSSSLASAVNLFIVHYYRKEVPEALDKHLYRIMMGAFVLTFVSFFVWTNGFADYLKYPLPNAFSFKTFIAYPGQTGNIAFYALCILSGALFVFFLCNYLMKKEYGQSNILESTFVVAFPAGIIGARLFYVIGNWAKEFDYGRAFEEVEIFGNTVNVWSPLCIWRGGLTILGGAIMGIVVGVAWFMWKRKQYSIWVAIDLIVPTILIAQAIGRWGNFFNIEVHGFQSDASYWQWLPRIIYNNAQHSSVAGVAETGKIFVPLFFIEFITNLIGYYVIAFVFGKKLRKMTELGDLGCLYIIWYGLTRVFLEPLRDANFNMGKDGYWSWVWSMIFVIVGCLLILVNHVVRYYIKKKKQTLVLNSNIEKRSLINLSWISLLTVALIVVGAVLMANGKYTGTISYSVFNVGLIVLILGVSALFIAGLAGFNLFTSKRYLKEQNNG